jgi:hypothetical protein
LTSTPAAQAIPSAIVWIVFSACAHLFTPPTAGSAHIASSVCKMSAIVLGIALALSSANIIPPISHHILLFVSVPLYVLQSHAPRVALLCSHLFHSSDKVASHLSSVFNVSLSADEQHTLSLALLLLTAYVLSGKASSGRAAWGVILYCALAAFILDGALPLLSPATPFNSILLETSVPSIILFLALHQFHNAPIAPSTYRNVFLATVYYVAIKFSLTL